MNVKRRALAFAAAVSVLLPLAVLTAAGSASAADPFANASVRNYIVRNDDGTASVRATYICPEGFHLWVSAKQSSTGRYDGRLEEEGSSQVAGAWFESHPTDFTCDGTRHTQTFTITNEEQGFGTAAAKPGLGAVLPHREITFISESVWVAVR